MYSIKLTLLLCGSRTTPLPQPPENSNWNWDRYSHRTDPRPAELSLAEPERELGTARQNLAPAGGGGGGSGTAGWSLRTGWAGTEGPGWVAPWASDTFTETLTIFLRPLKDLLPLQVF